MSESTESESELKSECCSSCPFVKLFLSQIFDFGYSCGSLISEALGLFKTFQRLSATLSFKIKFSPSCLEMFSWASQIFNLVASLFQTNPLSDFENYTVYTLILPITILILFSFSLTNRFYIYAFSYGVLLMLGAGFGFINVSFMVSSCCLIFSIPIIVFGLLYAKRKQIFPCLEDCDCHACCCFLECECFNVFAKREDLDGFLSIDEVDFLHVLLGFPIATFIFYMLMIPIMINRGRLIKVIAIMISIILVIAFIIACVGGLFSTRVEYMIGNKILNFLVTLITLLIIPSTECFIELMKGRYKNEWRCILSYIGLSLILPIAITLIDIFSYHQNITEKYKDDNEFFYFIELIDIVRQIIYAIMAGYDFIWGCVIIDIAWAIFILIIKPYKGYSEYYLTCGNCIVTSISNCAILYSIYSNSGPFSFGLSVALVVLAIIPAVLSMYVFFIKDFSPKYEYNNNSESMDYIGYFVSIITPFAWFLYGLNTPLIDKKISMPNI
ncbi:hypothetical protein M9Y10_035542 [Tritrichomonas musculus]|uniref:Integral membrane protein n=1 Tax=Tritrichomonas musculus TaxID=1915356 RepID=A0ABR2KIS5_9EUKA